MSNNSSNRINVPEARQALSNMKVRDRQRNGHQPHQGLQRQPVGEGERLHRGMMVKRMIEDYQRQASGK